jgi:predicted Na+-dependent transporter
MTKYKLSHIGTRFFPKNLPRYLLICFLLVSTLILYTFIESSTALPNNTGNNQVSNNQVSNNQVADVSELIISQAKPDQPTITPQPEFTVPLENTAILFQNDRYAVRVFRQAGTAYLNVYDKQAKTVIVKKNPVQIIKPVDPKKQPIQYIAKVGKKKYIVGLSPLGQSELLIMEGEQVIDNQSDGELEIAQPVAGILEKLPVNTNPIVGLVKKLFINYAKLTIFLLSFGLAIRWKLSDIVWLWHQPPLLLRSLLSVLILVPIWGILTISIGDLTVAEKIGIAAMVACPGAPLIPWKSLKVGGNQQYVASLQFTIYMLAIISIPATVWFLSQLSPRDAWLLPQDVVEKVFFVQILPMVIGVLIAEHLPGLAEEIAEPVNKIAKLMLLAVTVILLILTFDKVINAGFWAYLSFAFMGIMSLLSGHLLGGPVAANRSVLAYASCTRHAGLAILLVTMNFPNLDYIEGGIINTLVTYALVTGVISIPYTAWRKKIFLASQPPSQVPLESDVLQ